MAETATRRPPIAPAAAGLAAAGRTDSPAPRTAAIADWLAPGRPVAAPGPGPGIATWLADFVAPLPPAARLVFHGDARARAAALPVWGAAFSEVPCRAAVHASRATLWLGPDEYLLLDWNVESGAAGELESVLAGVPHALVDVSHRQFALEVRGPHATAILNAACPLDLDFAEFPVGMCTRTLLAKADIVLWRTRVDAFQLEVWRSFAGYVTGLLGEIAAEFHPLPPHSR